VEVETAIRARRTHKQYGEAPVAEETVRELFELARFAPNHRLTNPWRFRLLGPETRARVEALAGENEALKLRRAPTLVLATALLTGDDEIDAEDVLATGCAVYAVLLAATARGLASYWRTPACFGDAAVREALGLAESERVVALVHLGPPASEPPGKERAALDDVFSVLP
jgi:nitroreductase